ncbi:MAG: MBOAT family O-acyltransferase [Candidatus Falkowbacteria bacterium]
MLFNSIQFLIFFGAVYGLYLLVHKFFSHKAENRLLLAASYVFYAAWDWRFLSLIFTSALINFYCGGKIFSGQDERIKKRYLIYAVSANLLILGFFKYFDFFAANLSAPLSALGLDPGIGALGIILPLGISFYTFQAMTYAVDIYRGEIKPTGNFFDFALFVSFFPLVLAGPIERAKNLLPQITAQRTLSRDKFYEGCFLIFWGLVQKTVIADNLGARLVDPVFNGGGATGIHVLIAVYAFAIQIYCDFAGYSNIARGLAKCLGIELTVNFNLPYFAANPKDFWRRWHISLSSWFKDYVYIPLGGNRRSRARTTVNLLITMVLCGFWHGAAWTFLVWGAFHGILLAVYRLFSSISGKLPALGNLLASKFFYAVRVFLFFNVICLGWVIFRASSLKEAWELGRKLFIGWDLFLTPHLAISLYYFAFFSACLFVVEFFQYRCHDLLYFYRARPAVRIIFYLVCFYLIIIYGWSETQEFIYFQF